MFEKRMDDGEKRKLDWLYVDFEKYSKKCLWSAIFDTIHYHILGLEAPLFQYQNISTLVIRSVLQSTPSLLLLP